MQSNQKKETTLTATAVLLDNQFGSENCRSGSGNFHNILRLFDVLPNFSFTKSETMRDYYI